MQQQNYVKLNEMEGDWLTKVTKTLWGIIKMFYIFNVLITRAYIHVTKFI